MTLLSALPDSAIRGALDDTQPICAYQKMKKKFKLFFSAIEMEYLHHYCRHYKFVTIKIVLLQSRSVSSKRKMLCAICIIRQNIYLKLHSSIRL